VAHLRDVRAGRNAAQVEKCLNDLRTAASGEDNLMPPIIAAVKEYATLGEICDVLRRVFGEYREGC